MSDGQVVELPLWRVMPNPDQPRKTFDPVKLQGLANSIKAHGLIQPITVMPRGEWYLIVAGERRWRAHQLAGLQTIRALVQHTSDEKRDALALVENEQRVDVNMMETVEAWDRYRRKYEWSLEELARQVSRKKREVEQLLTLLKLAEEIKPLVARGEVSVTQALLLAPLTKSRQLYALSVLQEHRLNAREFEQLCKRLGQSEMHGTLFDLNAFLAQVEKRRSENKRERVRAALLEELSPDELLREMAKRGLAKEQEERVERMDERASEMEYPKPLRSRVVYEGSHMWQKRNCWSNKNFLTGGVG